MLSIRKVFRWIIKITMLPEIFTKLKITDGKSEPIL